MVKYMENIYKSNYIGLIDYSKLGSYFQTKMEESDFCVLFSRKNPAWYDAIKGYVWLYLYINRYGTT